MIPTFSSYRQRLSFVFLFTAMCAAIVPYSTLRAQTDQPLPIQPQASYMIYLPSVRGGSTSNVPGQPVVSTFEVDSPTIAPGGEATLRWTVSSATSVRIEPDIGVVTGSSVVVKPSATTTYTLIATNGAQETRATVMVTVDPNAGIVGMFVEPEKKTGNTGLVVDAQGGTHLAYAYHVPVAEHPNLVYSYCPPPASSCTDQSRWQRVDLLSPVDEVQLALTADGHPRILARGDTAQSSSKSFYYGECNSNCFDAQSWSFATVIDNVRPGAIDDVTTYYQSKRYFALDPQGRPRFAFYNYNYSVEPDLIGGYYAQCDAECADANSWSVTSFTHAKPENYRYESISLPSLAFTKAGAPRIVALLYPLESNDATNGIYYFGCDTGCDSDANWQRTKIADRGYGPFPSWDLALDSNDRPRVAFYKEDLTEGDSGKRLHYLSCDSNCLSDGSWNTLNFGLDRGVGDGADIALDAQDRPRIAYLDGSDNLRYSWCNTGCESGASWLHGTVETGDELDAAYPVTRPITCDAGLWDTFAPKLTFDAQGNPHIAYNGSYKAHCLYQDPTDPSKPPSSSFTEIWHSIRLTTFPQP